MLSRSVLRHAGWRPVQCPQYIALHAVLAGAVLPVRRLARRVRLAARGTGGSRGAAVVQPRGACAPRKLLDRLRASLRQKAPALCFAFARVLRQLSVYHSRRTLPRCFFIGVSQLRILVFSSISVGTAWGRYVFPYHVSLAPSRGGVLAVKGKPGTRVQPSESIL